MRSADGNGVNTEQKRTFPAVRVVDESSPESAWRV